MVGGESDFIASICCKIKSTITAFTPLLLERHKVPRAIFAGEIFLFQTLFSRCKWLNKPSKVSWRIHRVSMNVRQKPMGWRRSWRHLWRHTNEVTILRAQNGDKTMKSCSEWYGGAQAVAKSPCEWQKHFVPVARPPRRPRTGYPKIPYIFHDENFE